MTQNAIDNAASVIQMVTTELLTVASTTTTIPTDDTIPQISEGASLLTRTITPTSTNNTLLFLFSAWMATSTSSNGATFALFEDSTAGALYASFSPAVTTGGQIPNCWQFIKTAPSTSSISYSIRFGPNGALTAYVNGIAAGTRLFGGVESARLTILEISP